MYVLRLLLSNLDSCLHLWERVYDSKARFRIVKGLFKRIHAPRSMATFHHLLLKASTDAIGTEPFWQNAECIHYRKLDLVIVLARRFVARLTILTRIFNTF